MSLPLEPSDAGVPYVGRAALLDMEPGLGLFLPFEALTFGLAIAYGGV